MPCGQRPETQQRYAQIEKEALAVTWACEKFNDYILGRDFHIQTDHKPLIPLLSSKQLDRLPPRVLRFRLRLAWYSYTIQHVPGKLLYAADALLRAPAPGKGSQQLEPEVEAFVEAIVTNMPATKPRLDAYRQSQAQDGICSQVLDYCKSGLPDKGDIGMELLPYWKVRASLSVNDNLLLHGQCIVVPTSLQAEMLVRVHDGHQGIEQCRARINASVWWPGVINDMKLMIQRCRDCAREATSRKEPQSQCLSPATHGKWLVLISLNFRGNTTC